MLNTEFTVDLEDRPGTLGKLCRALADRGISIIALQAMAAGPNSLVRFVTDNAATAKAVLDVLQIRCTEAQVVQARVANRPGELARAATRLGEAKININYVYSGHELRANTTVLIFGVSDASLASEILEQTAAGT